VRENPAHLPLETRLYKFKNPAMKFFCPLCRTERAFTIKPHLNAKQHIQIAIISFCLMGLTYSFMGWRSIFWFFLVWSFFELAVRILFKKEIPCPHCGFDAAWYKRDVTVARAKVKQFWNTAKGKASEEAAEVLTEEAKVTSPLKLNEEPEVNKGLNNNLSA